MAEVRKVTIFIPAEIWGSPDADADVERLRGIAVAIGEVVAEYIQNTIAVDIAATGETTVIVEEPEAT